MHDNFGQLLRDGTNQVAQELTPAPAHLVRARGSQRSRRKAAGVTALAVGAPTSPGQTLITFSSHTLPTTTGP